MLIAVMSSGREVVDQSILVFACMMICSVIVRLENEKCESKNHKDVVSAIAFVQKMLFLPVDKLPANLRSKIANGSSSSSLACVIDVQDSQVASGDPNVGSSQPQGKKRRTKL